MESRLLANGNFLDFFFREEFCVFQKLIPGGLARITAEIFLVKIIKIKTETIFRTNDTGH